MGFMKFSEFNLSTNNDILNALAKCIFNIIKKVDFSTKAKPNFFSPLFSISLRLQRKPPRGWRRRPSFFTSPEKRCTILENILHSSYSAMIMRKMILVISNWIAASRHRVMYISCFPLDMKCFLFHCH